MNISIKNVSFSYTDCIDDAVLKDVNLQIESGECVVLAGESGSGKTTISKLINGLIPLYQSGTMAGDVLLGDKNTADMSLAEIAESYDISRQAVRDVIVRAGETLEKAEEELHVYRDVIKLSEIIIDVKTSGKVERLDKILNTLEEKYGIVSRTE